MSRRSVWSDAVWELDIDVAGRRADQKRLRWVITLLDGSRLTDPRMPICSRPRAVLRCRWRRIRPTGASAPYRSSLFTKARQLLTLIRWMIGEGLISFRPFDRSALERFQVFLQHGRGPRPGKTNPTTVSGYPLILKDLYRQRAKLPDALAFDPFPHISAPLVAEVSRATRGAIQFIPDAVAMDLM